jgi:hypothetical protein
MSRAFAKIWLGPSLLVLGLGVSGAMASAIKPIHPEALGVRSTVTPAAMCGYTCSRGGRYIPGPPSVCYERGLEYCGPSQERRGPSVVVPLPGGGSLGVYGDRRREEDRGRGCRTVTIEHDDGSIRRVRRCD